MKGRVMKYGIYKDTKLVSYDNKVDVPISVNDIFYLGRGFRTRDDLHESIKITRNLDIALLLKNQRSNTEDISSFESIILKKNRFGSDEEDNKLKEQ